jgi:superfamily II RNA helicase
VTLTDLMPSSADPDALFVAFTEWTAEQGITLYPAQEEALIEVVSGSNVILATPTGSGKSLVATGAHFVAMAQERRSFYTAPIKALVSEKFFALCDVFGAENVGMMTGDASVNATAPIVCCTAEVLANLALRHGADADVGQVVMDEFHFYGEPDRGWAWQVPILELPRAQFVLMSATLGDVSRFEADLSSRTGRPTAVVTSVERPVPLSFSYVTTPLHETLTELLETHQSPVYVVHFTQASALERAQALMSINVCSRAEKDAIAELIGGFRFTKGFGTTLSRLVRHGIGVHHAGMLPRYRRLVENLAQAGLLKVICGTDTLGVGINVPIRTVLLTSLSKYDGRRQRLLNAREFHQIAGRAGRAGFDTSGSVVVQAPEHVIENEKALAKAGDDVKKRRKVVRKKAPEGFVSWSEQTYERLVAAQPEALASRMRVTHSLVLNVIARPGDPVTNLRALLRDNHEEPARQVRLVRRAVEIGRALITAGVVERLPEPDASGRTVRLTVDLQSHFALNQPLSPFALAAFDVLDVESPTFALDVVSVVESTLDDPRPLLMAQQFKARGEAVAAMKSEGIEYEERMDLLEQVTWPKPLAELLEATFEIYRQGHPWVDESALSPKSVVRDMVERAMTFGELVAHYGLARSEGLVLRYLTDAYKALRHTVPDAIKTEELTDLIEWLGEVIRQTDSSLLDEWEALTNPDAAPEGLVSSPGAAPGGLGTGSGGASTGAGGVRPVTANRRAFRVMVRNAMFRRVELAALRRWDELAALDADLPADVTWSADDWADALAAYWDEHDDIGTGPDARGPQLLQITEQRDTWQVRQVLDDPQGFHDWAISAEVDLAASDEQGSPVVRITDVASL